MRMRGLDDRDNAADERCDAQNRQAEQRREHERVMQEPVERRHKATLALARYRIVAIELPQKTGATRWPRSAN